MQYYTVSNDRSIYEAWPDVALCDSGRLVCCFSECTTHGNRDLARITLVTSDDRGATWSERVTVGSDLRYNLCEASLLPLGGNELVCFMRENSGMGYDCLKSFSHDGGATWDGVYNTPMPGAHRPTSGFIHSTNPLLDGCILVTYRYMQGGGVCRLKDGSTRSFGSTQSVHGAIMRPESVKAIERFRQNARIFQLAYDRAPTPDLGYTGWVQFDDGEIYLVNYIRDLEDKAWIQGISFTPEELMA